MKAPSKNISKSLKGQSQGAGKAEDVSVTSLSRSHPMTVPGEGGVETAPGSMTGGRQERSAVNYAEPAGRVK